MESYDAPLDISSHWTQRSGNLIQGAIFMGFATSNELSELMNTIHISVFGKSIKERQVENPIRWQASSIDYSKYEQPAYVRNGG